MDGKSFTVSLSTIDVSSYYIESKNIYDTYDLDSLKAAISKKTGIKLICQYLVGTDEITVSTPLITLVNKVITVQFRSHWIFPVKQAIQSYIIRSYCISPYDTDKYGRYTMNANNPVI